MESVTAIQKELSKLNRDGVRFDIGASFQVTSDMLDSISGSGVSTSVDDIGIVITDTDSIVESIEDGDFEGETLKLMEKVIDIVPAGMDITFTH